jgi:AraC-like DNA-binding protein
VIAIAGSPFITFVPHLLRWLGWSTSTASLQEMRASSHGVKPVGLILLKERNFKGVESEEVWDRGDLYPPIFRTWPFCDTCAPNRSSRPLATGAPTLHVANFAVGFKSGTVMQSSRHHQAQQHRTNRAGIEAVSAISSRQFPRHAHDGYGLGLLDSGAHRTWSPIGYVEAVAGDVITINPEEMHDGAPVRGGTRQWRMIYFEPAMVANEIRDETIHQLEIAHPIIRDPELRRWLERLFESIIDEGHQPLAVEEAIVRVLMLVLHRHSARILSAQTASPAIALAREWLDEARGASVSLADLSAAAGVSRFQLVRGFAKEVGVTPYAYLMQRRVRAARGLIARGHSLGEAALEAGFSDQSHMTRAFVRQLGVTPARYRAALAPS